MTTTVDTEAASGAGGTDPTTQFHFAEPLVGPLLEWRPEYGTLADEGHTRDLGGGVSVFTSPDFAFHVNSVVVVSSDGAAVLDSQLLPRHAERIVADVAEQTSRPLRYVINSHHHPDHVWGNATFVAAGAEPVSSRLTARLVDRTAAGDQLFLLGLYGGHFPETFVVPRSTYAGSRVLWLGTTEIRLFEASTVSPVAGESLDMTFAWLPEQRVLHVGDALEPGNHVFFADGTSVPEWLAQLDDLRALVDELRPEVIVPGHGAPGDAGLIDVQERYLRTLAAMIRDHCRGGEVPLDDEAKAALRREILEAFPGYGNPILLDLSLDTVQLTGPIAFLGGSPDLSTADRRPVTD